MARGPRKDWLEKIEDQDTLTKKAAMLKVPVNNLLTNGDRLTGNLFANIMALQQSDILVPQQTAVEITGMSPAWFEMSRHKGTGIPYVKIGRAIRYRLQDIRQFVSDHYVATGI
ncbi:AlpA family transcriptional regulator [Trichlorobacter lovleyi]|uniref:helix-turn-helix transcriptional regulator n=1 Tax=Trichlorobacter lovleyi TaxID=313985 RepID=UPI0024801F69|nr:hypothetical protein [Trichlorobacter lovleyi]